MRIFSLLSGAPYGGVERQIERLSTVLEQDGFEQRAMLGENPSRAQKLAAIGVVSTEMPFPSRFAFMDRRRVNGTIRRFAPDVVVSWMPEVAALVERGPYIHMGRLGLGADLGALSRCDQLFTPSAARAETAKTAGWAADMVHVLPHLPRLESGDVAAVSRKKFFTPPTAKLIVTAIRLTRNCGLEVLLDAVARISGYYLWIAGDGADRAVYEQLAHEKGVKPRVRFMGWQDDLAPLIAAADVFIAPARQEDVGDTVTEGWAMGIPVIAADSLGPGLLIRHRENGVLVPVGDIISMAEAIKWVCQDATLARRLGEAGRLAFRMQYAADKVVPQYVELFRSLKAKPPMKVG